MSRAWPVSQSRAERAKLSALAELFLPSTTSASGDAMEAEEMPSVLCTAAVRLILGMLTAGAQFREAG